MITRTAALVERLEDVLLLGPGMPMPSVDHLEPPAAFSVGSSWHCRQPPPRRVNLTGVAEQVDQHLRSLPSSPRTGAVRAGTGSIREPDALLAQSGRNVAARFRHKRRQIKSDGIQLHPAGLDLREVEDLVDQSEQVLAAGADAGDGIVLFGREGRVAPHELRHSRGWHSARVDFVAHVRKEIGFRVVRRGRRGLRLLRTRPPPARRGWRRRFLRSAANFRSGRRSKWRNR